MSEAHDVLIIGGGPAGAISALVLARTGLDVCVLEKARHPRFHVGESTLPQNMLLIRELGLEDHLLRLPHVTKYGAEFAMGNDLKTMSFGFGDGLLRGVESFNIERSHLDQMLLNAARDAGARVLEETPVRAIVRLEQDSVAVATDRGDFSGRMLLDCSGQGTLIGRHLGTRRAIADDHLQKVSYFQHFHNVERPEGLASGHATILMSSEGWFWIIPLNEHKSSVGFVCHPKFSKEIGVPPQIMLNWAIQRCPILRHRMRAATGPETNHILSDYSYDCRPYAGPGYMLVGDAACFLDPIFSTGVALAMIGGREAARHTLEVLSGRTSPASARRKYAHFIEQSSAVFWRLIRGYYKHSFRELFLEGQGPLQMHRAVISILAGQVFPRPIWALRWRFRLFELSVLVQRYLPLVPRRKPFSLLAESPAPAEAQALGAS